MANLFEEGLLTLAQAAKLKKLPRRRGDRPIHISTLIRWAKHGIGGIRLETIRVGSTLCTSEPAILRFFERLTDTPESAPGGGATIDDDKIDRCAQRLARQGI